MTQRTPGFWLLVAACAVVAAAVVAGLLTVGGAGTARLEKLDRERLADLDRIQSALARERMLPSSLDSLAAPLSPDDLTDPVTGERYGYRVLSDSTYELCAVFALASEELDSPPYGPRSLIGAYEAGRHCFTVDPEQEATRSR